MANIDTSTYTAQAVSGEIIESQKEGGEPSMMVKLRVTEGPSTGRDITWYGSLHPNAAEYTLKTLRDMGWQCNDITVLEGLGSTKVILKGKADEYNGKIKQKWMVFAVRVPRPELDADVKASFAERFKALAIAAETVKVLEANAAGPLPEPITNIPAQTTSSTNGVDAGGVNF